MEYVLLFVTDETGATLRVPLGLNGSETTDEAAQRFKDALVVARHQFAEKDGRQPNHFYDIAAKRDLSRIDGL